MASDSLPKKQLFDATRTLLEEGITIQQVGAFVATAGFLADRLSDLGDPLSGALAAPIEILEEVYAVALDHRWSDLPEEERTLARNAAIAIRDLVGKPDSQCPLPDGA
jgi:hypothetical protein